MQKSTPRDLDLKSSKEAVDAAKNTTRKLSFDPATIKVLVVDDEAVTLKIVCNYLNKAGYEGVVAVQDAKSALEHLRSGKTQFHLVLTDVHMPEMDGVQLLHAIKSDEKLKNLPVIMMSATEDLNIVYQCLKSGADDYLLKPISREMVKGLWQNVWRKRREHLYMNLLVSEKTKTHVMDEQVKILEAEIANLKGKVTEAVETPIAIIMKTLKDIISANHLTAEVRDALTNILKNLSSCDLYRPAIGKLLSQQEMENVAKVWLSPEIDLQSPEPRSSPPPPSSPPLLLDSNVQSRIAELRNWNFDLWSFSEDDLLSFLAAIFYDFNFLERFNIPPSTLSNFLQDVKNNYRKQNPYHNFRHCFDVVHTTYFFLTVGKARELLSAVECFALIISALGHDVDHPGLNNTFQILTNSPLALEYNDKSVLENYHCSRLFVILNKPDSNITVGLTSPEFREFRTYVINTILSTDLGLHVDLLGKFNSFLECFIKESKEHKTLLLQLIIKCADISNVARPFSIAKYWAELVQEEFFFQGEKEKEHCLPISPYMDRSNKCPLSKMQLSFIDFIVAPIYSRLVKLFPDLNILTDTLAANIQIWKNLLRDEES